jgi:ABC-type phosphate transport system substrate-binding protein
MVSKRYISIVLLTLGLFRAETAGCQALSGLTIIANNIGTKSMKEQQVIDAFKAKNNLWSNGKAVAVCLPPTESSDASEISRKIYGKSVSEVQKFWLAIVFQGRSRSPHFAESDQDLIKYISQTPGAIGAFVNEKGLPIPAELSLQISQ